MEKKTILEKAKDIILGNDKPQVTQLPNNSIDHLDYIINEKHETIITANISKKKKR